jgi:hypothetical protein
VIHLPFHHTVDVRISDYLVSITPRPKNNDVSESREKTQLVFVFGLQLCHSQMPQMPQCLTITLSLFQFHNSVSLEKYSLQRRRSNVGNTPLVVEELLLLESWELLEQSVRVHPLTTNSP